MNSEDFNKCREFLESQISEKPENKELLAVYQRLIEVKGDHDKETQKAMIEKEIREAECQKQFQSTAHTNNTQFEINANNNLSATQQNYQNNAAATRQNYDTQQAGVFNNFLNNGLPYLNKNIL